MIRAAASRREAAPAAALALWTDLLARLSLAAVASTQAPSLRQLRALGVRRTGTLAVNLSRELAMAYRMAAAAGVAIAPLALQRRVGELAEPGELAWHLRGLASAYARLLLDTPNTEHGSLAAWLAARHRMHLGQAETMERVATPGP